MEIIKQLIEGLKEYDIYDIIYSESRNPCSIVDDNLIMIAVHSQSRHISGIQNTAENIINRKHIIKSVFKDTHISKRDSLINIMYEVYGDIEPAVDKKRRYNIHYTINRIRKIDNIIPDIDLTSVSLLTVFKLSQSMYEFTLLISKNCIKDFYFGYEFKEKICERYNIPITTNFTQALQNDNIISENYVQEKEALIMNKDIVKLFFAKILPIEPMRECKHIQGPWAVFGRFVRVGDSNCKRCNCYVRYNDNYIGCAYDPEYIQYLEENENPKNIKNIDV